MWDSRLGTFHLRHLILTFGRNSPRHQKLLEKYPDFVFEVVLVIFILVQLVESE